MITAEELRKRQTKSVKEIIEKQKLKISDLLLEKSQSTDTELIVDHLYPEVVEQLRINGYDVYHQMDGNYSISW